MDDPWGNAWSDPPQSSTSPDDSQRRSASQSWALPSLPAADPLPATNEFASAAFSFSSPPTWEPAEVLPNGVPWGGSGFGLGTDLPTWGGEPSPTSDAWRPGGSDPPRDLDKETDDLEEHAQANAHLEEEIESPPEALPVTTPAFHVGSTMNEDASAALTVSPTERPFAAVAEDGNFGTSSPHLRAPSPLPNRSSSPDGFGTFESGVTAETLDAGAWSPIRQVGTSLDANVSEPGWASTWGGAASISGNESDPVDSWAIEQAKIARREQLVPTQLITSILADWREFSEELYPSPKEEHEEEELPQGMEKVDGLSTLMSSLAPEETTMPILPQFSSTFVARNMISAVKLTRHLPLSRLSPMSHLLSSKGSVAWENSVKSRSEPVADDWSWMGGKPKESEPTSTAAVDAPAEKKSGFFGSLWGRSNTPAPTSTNALATAAPSSPVKGQEVVPPSPSVSQHSPKPPVSATNSPKPSISEVRRSIDSTRNTLASIRSSTPSLVTASSIPSTSSPVETSVDETSTAPDQGPSAVSRFWGRFSRSRSGVSSNPRAGHQVSLSASDISYLEEVPTFGADEDPEDQMQALEDLLTSQPSTSNLSATFTPGTFARRTSSTSISPSPVRSTTAKDDDMWSIFEKPGPSAVKYATTTHARMASASRSNTPILAPVLAPPPKSTVPSRTTTPAPLSGSPSQRPMSLTSTPSKAFTLLPPPPPKITSPRPPQPPPKHQKVPSDDFADFETAFMETSSPTFSPQTPNKPNLSPIITSATPTTAKRSTFALSGLGLPVDLKSADDDSFGDFASSTQTVDTKPITSPPSRSSTLTPGSFGSNLPSPRITAPDTPLYPPDPNKPHQPARSSLAPLMNKIAKTQSDKWPRPEVRPQGSLPPVLAPPPPGPTSRPAAHEVNDYFGMTEDMISPVTQSPPTISARLASPPTMHARMRSPPPLNTTTRSPPLIQATASPSDDVPLAYVKNGIIATMQNPTPALAASQGLPFLPPPPDGLGSGFRPPSMPSILSPPSLSKPANGTVNLGALSTRQSAPTPAPSKTFADGKLSAADLSFFEGL